MATRRKARFGTVRTLPSGRIQARYTNEGERYALPVTFLTEGDAWTALETVHTDIVRQAWKAPAVDDTTFGEYAEAWLPTRNLTPRSREEYRKLLDGCLLPAWGKKRLASITADDVDRWFAKLPADTPTRRAHAYGLFRTIIRTAWKRGKIASYPCQVEGGSVVRRATETTVIELEELDTIVGAIPERYRAMVLLATWCAMRFGELTELRRRDVDVRTGALSIRRGVTKAEGEFVVGAPKSSAGVRVVHVPPHLLPMLRDHLAEHVREGRDALLFPAAEDATKHMAPATLYRVWYPAREAAGRDDLRFHDLRHSGATWAARVGATPAEVMYRLGHATTGVHMRYQHASAERDKAVAAALSAWATKEPATVVPITAATRKPRRDRIRPVAQA